MPVVFDQVVGTVDAPASANESSGEGESPPPPPAAARQLLAQMLRDRDKRLARIRAD